MFTTAVVDQRGLPIPVNLVPENGEYNEEEFILPGVNPEDFDPTVPFTCFITTFVFLFFSFLFFSFLLL